MWLIKKSFFRWEHSQTFCEIFLPVQLSHPQPLCIIFFKRELSPLHNMNTCCAPPTAPGPQETGNGRPPLLLLFHPHINLSSTPLPSLYVPFLLSSLLPLLPCLPVSRLLLNRHFTDTPTETSDLISGQEVRGFKFLL